MNNKRLISLTICWISVIALGLCVSSFAENESGTNTEAKQHFEKANELRKIADYDAAITEYKKTISLSPNSKIAQDAQYWIGQSHFKAGQLDAALAAFQTLLDEYPASPIIPSTKKMIERIQQAKKNKSLFEAAEKGDIEQIKKVIDQGADVNANEGDSATTTLHAAARGGHGEAVKVLLANGANVNLAETYGYTALYYAIWNDDEEIVKALISSGIDVNKGPADEEGDYSPLCYAIWRGHASIVKDVLDAGADLNVKDDNGYTPLYWAAFTSNKEVFDLVLAKKGHPDTIHLAAAKGDLDRVKVLMERENDVNAKDEFGCTPLHWAALADSPVVADFLIAKGAVVDAEERTGWTPLMRASALPVVELLIAKGADIHSIHGPWGRTKMHMECARGNKETAELLINKGVDVNARARSGATALFYAAINNHADIVELLIKKGADINIPVNQGDTPLVVAKQRKHTEVVNVLRQHGATETLHGAAASGDTDTVKRLLSKGADINARVKSGNTPVLIAARSGQEDIVTLLIENGADINLRNNSGDTPLILAKKRKRTEVVNILHQHGAIFTLHDAAKVGNINEVRNMISQVKDVNVKNQDGKTPLHLAANRGHKAIVQLLLAGGADIETREYLYSSTPLLHAAGRGRKEIVELLLEKGADIEGKNSDGLTPLHLTAGYGSNIHTDVIQLLLEKGADIETRGHGDTTPLQTAVAVGRKEVAELLLTHGAKVDVISRQWGTPVNCAMRENHPELVRWCIAKGIDIPPLHQAAYFGETDRVQSLLRAGADINQKDKAGFTSLHCAVFGRRKGIVQLLLKNGADIKAISCADAMPLFWACDRGYLDMVKVLVDNGADVKGRAIMRMTWGPDLLDNWSNLHMAAHAGHTDVVEYLLDNGADIHARCTRGDEGLTPLHLAARNGHVDVVKVLLAKGADANLRSKEGRTALDFAKQKNRTDVINLLQKRSAKE